jgi:hypothetical protein
MDVLWDVAAVGRCGGPSRTDDDPRIRNRRNQPCQYLVEELQVSWCKRRESGGGFGEDACPGRGRQRLGRKLK